MVKKGILVFFAVLLVAQLAVAEQEIVSLELIKEKYSAGETVQVRLVTEHLERPLKAEQLALYIDDVKDPIAPFFTRYSENTYLLYFDLPIVIDGRAIFKVEKILYRGSAGLQEYTVEKEIPIAIEPTSILSIIPGFVVLDKNQQEIQVQIENKKGDSTFNISASPSIAHVYSALQTINLGGRRTFKFTADQTKLEEDTAIFIEHTGNTYKIAVMKRQEIKEPQPGKNITDAQEENKLVFITTKPEVRKTITKDTSLIGIVSLKNEGNETIEGILLGLTGNLEPITSIDTTMIPSLQPGEMKDITVSINKEQEGALGTYEGVLLAKAGIQQATFPIAVTIEAKQPQQEINRTTVDLDLKRAEPPDGLDINLPKPKPLESEKEYPLGLILVTFFLVLIAVGFYFLKKKQVAKEETFDDYIKKIRK